MEHFLQFPKALPCKPSDLDIIVLLKDEATEQKHIDDDDDEACDIQNIDNIVEAQIPRAQLTKRMLSRIQMKHVFIHGYRAFGSWYHVSHGDARLFMCDGTCKYRKFDP